MDGCTKLAYEYIRTNFSVGQLVTSADLAVPLGRSQNNVSAALFKLERAGMLVPVGKRGRKIVRRYETDNISIAFHSPPKDPVVRPGRTYGMIHHRELPQLLDEGQLTVFPQVEEMEIPPISPAVTIADRLMELAIEVSYLKPLSEYSDDELREELARRGYHTSHLRVVAA